MLRNVIFIASHALRKLGFNFHERDNPIVQEMEKKINELGSIQFKVELYPDGSWTAESVNIDGIITGSDNTRDMNMLIKDAIFTYFDIPPYMSDDELLKANNEPVTMKQNVWATR